ncbi:MAG: peptide chain release factor N(5)-glutamine methyltransferase [Ignavibacteria bacterium]|nr:peptide chain release factor N(5)-glutamine methyltransferase [Ignavibacteria bacterium]
MLTILDAIKLSTDYLEKKGIESARLNSELMLAEILNCKRLDLYLKFEQPLQEYEVDKLREWISRRGKFEPLQYIIGKADFYGARFNVNSFVLIPRPETEILVDRIIVQNKNRGSLRILDIGTGSGIIPIVLALHIPDATICSIDNSSDAIEIAKQNAVMNNVAERIEFLTTDLFSAKFEDGSFDIIVSNPPYVPLDEYGTLQKEIVDYEPKQAVTDMGNGLKFYSYISEKAKLWLRPGGRLYYEVGKDQYETVKIFMGDNGFKNITAVKDLLSIDRVVIGEKL